MIRSVLLPKSFRPTILLVFLYLVCGLSLSQCKKASRPIDDNALKCLVEPVIGKENDIVGKWKLVKSHSPMMNKTEDYSCSDIVYNFRADGTLLITENGTDPKESLTFSYEVIKKPYLENIAPFTLKRDALESGCSIAKESMVLNSAPLDGDIKTFVRIE